MSEGLDVLVQRALTMLGARSLTLEQSIAQPSKDQPVPPAVEGLAHVGKPDGQAGEPFVGLKGTFRAGADKLNDDGVHQKDKIKPGKGKAEKFPASTAACRHFEPRPAKS